MNRIAADDDYEYEYALEDQQRRQYELQLRQAPDCRDPAHPGCNNCMDADEDEEETSPYENLLALYSEAVKERAEMSKQFNSLYEEHLKLIEEHMQLQATVTELSGGSYET